MKILVWLCIFLSIPLLAFTASKQPSSISAMKETGKALATTGIILVSIALLRFPAKRYLSTKHSKQHSFLRNTSQKIIKNHNFFAITSLILLIGHGILLAIVAKYWTMRVVLGILAFVLFSLTSVFGYLITKRRLQKQVFYNLHLTFLLLALSATLVHVKYKVFSWLL
jgi:hypothetical protein